jgi:SAM-dependent methyltransferase
MNTRAVEAFEEVISTGPFPIRFPKFTDLDQDEEWCEVEWDGAWHRIRFHDYNDVYTIPNLYETIFYRTLRCNSPKRVTDLLAETLAEYGVAPEDLNVLDVGAGNGMVGEALQSLGIRRMVGVDIIPEAKEASERDRAWVYSDYLVADLTAPTPEQQRFLEEANFNALTTVAALGYGDMPVAAFANAYNVITDGGWLAFNIKEDFLMDRDLTGFAGLVNRMTNRGIIRMECYKRYCHRLSITADPLYYIAVVARKLRPIPQEFIDDAS